MGWASDAHSHHLKVTAAQVSGAAFRRTAAWLALWLLMSSGAALASETSCDETADTKSFTGMSRYHTCTNNKDQLKDKISRLSAYEPNTAAYERAQGDDASLEVNYSLKYMITRPDCSVEQGEEQEACLKGYDSRWEVFFSYTGKFDFYFLSRPSSPVINRASNPALHYRLYQPLGIKYLSWLDLGAEHRSNGQTTDCEDKDGAGDYIAEQRWKDGDRAYIDSMSMSANYLSVGLSSATYSNPLLGSLQLWLSAKVYLTDDSRVTWGSHQGSRIWDYDLVRLEAVGKRFFNSSLLGEVEYSLEYTIGSGGFATDSLDGSLYFPVTMGKRYFFLPNYLSFHLGPMKELSNYTESQTSWSIGYKLNPCPRY